MEMEGPATEEHPATEALDGPPVFGPFIATSSGDIFQLRVPATTVVVKTEEEEQGIPGDNEEDLMRRGRWRKKEKTRMAAKHKAAEEQTEVKVKTEEETEAQVEPQAAVVRPPPRVAERSGVFYEIAISTGKQVPVNVEYFEILDSDDETPAS